jgi:hypothetical protein
VCRISIELLIQVFAARTNRADALVLVSHFLTGINVFLCGALCWLVRKVSLLCHADPPWHIGVICRQCHCCHIPRFVFLKTSSKQRSSTNALDHKAGSSAMNILHCRPGRPSSAAFRAFPSFTKISFEQAHCRGNNRSRCMDLSFGIKWIRWAISY